MNAKCPCCKGTETVKRGFNYTRKRGKQQRMKCKSCNHTFIVDLGFWHMRNKEEIIAMCVDMYLSNLSSRKMRNQLLRHFGIKISHVTILDWVRKYVQKVQKYVQKLNPVLGGRLYADETEVKREDKNDIFWCAIDWDTRFINATLYSNKHQNMKDAIKFMRNVKKSVDPEYIQTDALPMYPRAFRKVFYNYYPDKMPQHRVNNVSKTKRHNVRIETVFSKIKDRVNDFRGFKALWSAPILMAGIVLQHNFIERHNSTNIVPCDLANMNLNLGENRWMDLIRLSAMSEF